MTKIMTAHEKSARGLSLSAADIQELLKDPNSEISKLYNECQLIAAITHAEFVHLVHMIMLEHKLDAQALATKEILSAERAREKEAKYYSEQYSNQQTDRHAGNDHRTVNWTDRNDPQYLSELLKQNMSELLVTSQDNMSLAKLAAHHKEVTANFNNQIAAKLGSAIEMSVKVNNDTQNISLSVPQMTSRPITSVATILKRNPAMPHSKRFATHAVLAGTGYLATLNKWREILEHNREALMAKGINVDDIQLTPQLLKQIDNATKACLNDNSQLLEHLLENNLRSIGKGYSIAKLPTLFATQPVKATKAKREEEEHETDLKPPIKHG